MITGHCYGPSPAVLHLGFPLVVHRSEVVTARRRELWHGQVKSAMFLESIKSRLGDDPGKEEGPTTYHKIMKQYVLKKSLGF